MRHKNFQDSLKWACDVPDEAEFDSYLHIGNLIAVMQSKARLALRRKNAERTSFVNQDLIRQVLAINDPDFLAVRKRS